MPRWWDVASARPHEPSPECPPAAEHARSGRRGAPAERSCAAEGRWLRALGTAESRGSAGIGSHLCVRRGTRELRRTAERSTGCRTSGSRRALLSASRWRALPPRFPPSGQPESSEARLIRLMVRKVSRLLFVKRYLPAPEGNRVFWGRRMEDGKRRSAWRCGGAQPPPQTSSGGVGRREAGPGAAGPLPTAERGGRRRACPRAERCAASVARRKGRGGFGRVGEAFWREEPLPRDLHRHHVGSRGWVGGRAAGLPETGPAGSLPPLISFNGFFGAERDPGPGSPPSEALPSTRCLSPTPRGRGRCPA